MFCFTPGRKECKDAPGARLLLRCPKSSPAALAAAGFDRGAATCSLFSASWGTSGLCPSPPIPLAMPKTAPHRVGACWLWPRRCHLLAVSCPAGYVGVLPLAPDSSCGAQTRPTPRALAGSLLRCPKPPSAAFAAAGFDRGANPCSLLPALRALAGVAFCKRRAKTLKKTYSAYPKRKGIQ